MDRAEHLAWCKARAREYLDQGNVQDAITSMLSDLGKHPELRPNNYLSLLGMRVIMNDDRREAERFIEGFR